jgi:hypothetical protein
MKIILMTESGTESIFDVFDTVTIPEDRIPQGFAERWASIEDASPIQPIIVTGKENLFIDSVFDPENESFTMSENMDSTLAKNLTDKFAVFLIDNLVVGIAGISPAKADLLEAAYSSPVTVKILDNNNDISQGYVWDGIDFYPSI